MIVFDKVRFKNFGSFGNYFTEIDLNKGSSILVAGNNGNGKSFALLDSITFGLFGRPFRKVNIPQLVNSINEKDCVVEVEFKISKNEYKIIRGLKPKIFEIYKNGKLLDQNAKFKDYQKMLEEQILKMNYKSFTQVVILGSSSFVPFMQLTAADRREVIEDILDIQIFSIMNTLLKSKISQQKEKLKEIEYNTSLLKEKCDVQKEYIEKIKKTADTRISKNIQTVKDEENVIITTQEQIETIRKEIESTNTDPEEIKNTRDKIKLLESLKSKMEGRHSNTEKELKFFEENESCPKCQQKIHLRKKTDIVINSAKNLMVLQEGLEKMESQISEIYDKLENRLEVEESIKRLQSKISAHQSKIDSMNQYISKIQNETTELISDKNNINQLVEKEVRYQKELNEHMVSKNEIVKERHCQDIAYSLLKDSGIKTKIIKNYLPAINQLINKYLTAMDFFAKFHLDENFSESIKSRHRDDFSYMSFSEGEKMRIDLALLMTWREIARLKNSANTNLLILDEVFDSSLDMFGTEEFLKLIHTICGTTNVFVISHKSDQLIDKFTEYITFEKKNDFSHMKR